MSKLSSFRLYFSTYFYCNILTYQELIIQLLRVIQDLGSRYEKYEQINTQRTHRQVITQLYLNILSASASTMAQHKYTPLGKKGLTNGLEYLPLCFLPMLEIATDQVPIVSSVISEVKSSTESPLYTHICSAVHAGLLLCVIHSLNCCFDATCALNDSQLSWRRLKEKLFSFASAYVATCFKCPNKH